jgi:hypothetical protein
MNEVHSPRPHESAPGEILFDPQKVIFVQPLGETALRAVIPESTLDDEVAVFAEGNRSRARAAHLTIHGLYRALHSTSVSPRGQAVRARLNRYSVLIGSSEQPLPVLKAESLSEIAGDKRLLSAIPNVGPIGQAFLMHCSKAIRNNSV